MGQFFIVLAGALVLGAVVFGVTVLIVGGDQGLEPVEPDGRAVPLPAARPLTESDLSDLRFDVAFRGYRMAQVDQALRRSAYDLGYKEELIGVLEAEVEALRDGRLEEADKLRAARLASARPRPAGEAGPDGAGPDGDEFDEAGFEDAAGDGAEPADTVEDAVGDADSGGGLEDAGARPDGRTKRGAGSPTIDLGLIGDPAAVEPAK
jgi:DivIVA domain-containing protein